MGYIPGRENLVADVLSRWAYPASQALRDVSRHGSGEDKEEMEKEISWEKEEETQCLWIKLRDQPNQVNRWIRGVGDDRPRKPIPPLPPLGMGDKIKIAPPQILVTPPTPREISGEVPRPEGEGVRNLEDTNTQVVQPQFSSEGDIFGEENDASSSSVAPQGVDFSVGPDFAQGGRSLSSSNDPFWVSKPVWEKDWGREYAKCPMWNVAWSDAQQGDWPAGFHIFKDRMYFDEKLCVPFSLQNLIIVDVHEFRDTLLEIVCGHTWRFATIGQTKVWPKNLFLKFVRNVKFVKLVKDQMFLMVPCILHLFPQHLWLVLL